MNRLRVLFISDSATLGGAPRVLLDLVRYLDRDHFEPYVMLGRTGPAAPQLSRLAPTYTFPYPLRIPKTGWLQNLIRPAAVKLWLHYVVTRVRPHLLYHNSVAGVGCLNTTFSREVPRIIHVHGMHSKHLSMGMAHINAILDHASHYICCAKCVAEQFEACLGVTPEKITTIHAGVDVKNIETLKLHSCPIRQTYFHAASGDVVIGGAGTFIFDKGIDLMVKTAHLVRQRCSQRSIRFVWIGGDPYSSGSPQGYYARAVVQYANRLGLGDMFLFAGHQADPYRFLDALDIFVMCSRQEALPLVVMEAMCLGKPVVSFPVGGVPEILKEGIGLLTKGFSPDELASAICKLVEQPEMRRGLVSAAYQKVIEDLDIAKNVRLFEEIITRTATDRGNGSSRACSR